MLPKWVQWDRGIVGDEEVTVYGWIPRKDGRRDFAVVCLDRKDGSPVWWATSSAKYSKRLHEELGGAPEDHWVQWDRGIVGDEEVVDSVPVATALAAIGQTAAAPTAPPLRVIARNDGGVGRGVGGQVGYEGDNRCRVCGNPALWRCPHGRWCELCWHYHIWSPNGIRECPRVGEKLEEVSQDADK